MTLLLLPSLLILLLAVVGFANGAKDGQPEQQQQYDGFDGNDDSIMTIIGQPATFGVAWSSRRDNVNSDQEEVYVPPSPLPPIKARVLYLPSNPLLCDNVEQTIIEEENVIEYVAMLSTTANTASTATI